MHLAITGGTGFVGRFIVAAALSAGHGVTLLSRRSPAALPRGTRVQHWQLGDAPGLSGVDALVHAAFAHVPGRYRGGEGDDPSGFLLANRDGSLRLFDAARAAGVPVVLHLSSRAVFDGYPPGTLLTEDLAPRPTSLYGEIKAELEAALAAATSQRMRGISLRATGVFGEAAPGQPNKWSHLVAELAAGRPIPARVATEVYGGDLASAVLLLLDAAIGASGDRTASGRQAGGGRPASAAPVIAHASDIILDHRDLARAAARCLGRDDIPLPPRSDAARLSMLGCSTLHRLGWQPQGWDAFDRTLSSVVARAVSAAARDGT